MDDKFTPGPWSVWTSNSYRRLVSDRTGREVIAPTIQKSDGHPDLYFPNGGADGPDALLIAAAPDLLKALMRLMSTGLDQRTHFEIMSDPSHYANAAIAKATGAKP